MQQKLKSHYFINYVHYTTSICMVEMFIHSDQSIQSITDFILEKSRCYICKLIISFTQKCHYLVILAYDCNQSWFCIAVPRKTRIMSNETRKPDLFVTAVVVLVPSKTASFNSPRSILNFRGTTETFENKRVLTNNRNNQEKKKNSNSSLPSGQ